MKKLLKNTVTITQKREWMGTLKTPVCKEGKEALLAFDGSVWDYFWKHLRGFEAMKWLERNCGYLQFEAPERFTHYGGNLYLRGYKHPLPEGFTHCGLVLNLVGYKYPLPESFTHCGEDLYLRGYEHPLPESFTHCGGDLYLRGYKYPLPEGFTHCGGNLDMRGYAHPLPEGFTYCGFCWT